tara:strand:+ start:55 stop:303 length:249 start_codon:yes stop_codon:yes gene_type:complete
MKVFELKKAINDKLIILNVYGNKIDLGYYATFNTVDKTITIHDLVYSDIDNEMLDRGTFYTGTYKEIIDYIDSQLEILKGNA